MTNYTTQERSQNALDLNEFVGGNSELFQWGLTDEKALEMGTFWVTHGPGSDNYKEFEEFKKNRDKVGGDDSAGESKGSAGKVDQDFKDKLLMSLLEKVLGGGGSPFGGGFGNGFGGGFGGFGGGSGGVLALFGGGNGGFGGNGLRFF